MLTCYYFSLSLRFLIEYILIVAFVKSRCAATRLSLLEAFGSGAVQKQQRQRQQRRSGYPPSVSPCDPCVSRCYPLPRTLGRPIALAARCATSMPATARATPVRVSLRRPRRGGARGHRAQATRALPLPTPTQPLGGLRIQRAVLLGLRGRWGASGTGGGRAAAAGASALRGSCCDI